MADIWISLVIVLLVGIGTILIFVITGRNKKKKEDTLALYATQQGWAVEKINTPNQHGFRLRGTDWVYETLSSTDAAASDSTSNPTSHRNLWSSDHAVSKHGMVLIGPKLPSVQLGNFGDLLLRKAFETLLGDNAADAAGLHEVKTGRISLAQRYTIWAVSEEGASEVITPEVENALLKWQHKELPVVKIAPMGAEIITRQSRMDTPETVQQVVDLGNALLGAQAIR
mgnify:FL=1